MVEMKKNAVLKAAEFLFSSKGFNKTTVAEIAIESGIHEASIYSYFGNKRYILFTIYARYLENAIKSLNEHFLGMKEPGPKLRKAIWHYLADMRDNPNYAKTLMMAQRESTDFYSSEYVQYVKQYSGLVLTVIIEGQKEGFFQTDISPRSIRNMAMGASVFTAFHSIINNLTYDPNEMSDIIYQLVLNAVGSEAPVQQTTAKPTRKKKAELRRAQIIEAAAQVFSAEGFSNATISEVARKANLGDATLYEYFDNKEQILMSIAEIYLENLNLEENQKISGVFEPEKALRNLIWTWVWLIYSHEDFSRLLVLEFFRNVRFYSSRGFKYIQLLSDRILDVIERGQKQGVFIEDVPFPTYFHMITGIFDQFLLSQFLLHRPPLGLNELNGIVNCLVRAIKVRKN